MKIEICISIILILLRHGKTSAKDLAERFLVSTKTIYRYLAYLDMCEIPIITKRGRNGGIYLINKLSLNNIYLSDEEKYILLDKINEVKNSSIKNSLIEKLGI